MILSSVRNTCVFTALTTNFLITEKSGQVNSDKYCDKKTYIHSEFFSGNMKKDSK